MSNVSMKRNEQTGPSWKAVFLPVCSGAALVWLLVAHGRFGSDILLHGDMDWFLVLLSPVVLLSAALLLHWHPRVGYTVAALGAAFPLPWIFMTESRSVSNSWIAMNASYPDASRYIRYSQIRILSVALLLMTLIWAITRLLPERWQLQNRPANQRTWPAIAITLVFIACWFAAFVLPYRQPLIVDAAQPELSILNVKKDGIGFHETRVSLYRDGRYFIVRDDRQLFRYSFAETVREGFLTDELRTNLSSLQALPELQRTLDKSPRALRVWHGEGWYIEMHSFAITAFTTENASPPPAHVVEFFRELEEAPSRATSMDSKVRDVCLGFCYDPKAGLGYRAENQRCWYPADRKEHCY
jgi:hypothetical protein